MSNSGHSFHKHSKFIKVVSKNYIEIIFAINAPAPTHEPSAMIAITNPLTAV